MSTSDWIIIATITVIVNTVNEPISFCELMLVQ